MGADQGIDDRGAVVLGRGAQVGDGHFVAALLALPADFLVGPPDERMEPEDRLREDLQTVHRRIEAQDVADFVSEDVPPAFIVCGLSKGLRQVNIAAQETPDERLPDPLHEPYSRGTLHPQGLKGSFERTSGVLGQRVAFSAQPPDGPSHLGCSGTQE